MTLTTLIRTQNKNHATAIVCKAVTYQINFTFEIVHPYCCIRFENDGSNDLLVRFAFTTENAYPHTFLDVQIREP